MENWSWSWHNSAPELSSSRSFMILFFQIWAIMPKTKGDCGICNQRLYTWTAPQKTPIYVWPVGFSVTSVYVHTQTGARWVTKTQLSQAPRFAIPLEWVFKGSHRSREDMHEEEGGDLSWTDTPLLNFRVSERFGFLASCLWQAQPYRCAMGFRPRSACLLHWEATPERQKHWQQRGALDLSNGKTPASACALLRASTHVLWEVEKTWGWGGWQERENSLQMGEGKRKTPEPTFPSRSEPTLQTYIFPHWRIIIPLSSQSETISSW